MTCYVRIRGVNQEGDGDWSFVQSTQIEIPNNPQFDETYQYPANAQTNISKQPVLKWRASDDDGDELEYRILFGTNENSLDIIRHFKIEYEGGTEYDFAVNSEKPLLPGKTYYWQIVVREVGKSIDDYGGEYIHSPIWSFTTELKGSDPAIIGVEQISDLRPNTSVKFRLTVQNLGDEQATPQYIKSKYIKNGEEYSFYDGDADIDQNLAPGQTEYVDIEVVFRDRIIEQYGNVYDNILIPGESLIKFYFSFPDKNDVSLANNEMFKTINYEDKNPPVITYLNLLEFGSTHQTNDTFWARAGKDLNISLGAYDDDALSRCVYEYRFSSSEAWKPLHTDYYDLQYYNRSHPLPIPIDTPPTDTAQVKVTVYDSQNNRSEQISDPFSIYSSNINATIKPDKNTYLTGDTIHYEISFNADNTVEYAEIHLEVGDIFKRIHKFALSSNGTTYQFQWNIPYGYLSNYCYLILTLTDNRGTEKDYRSNLFQIRPNTALPAPFNEMITLYDNEKKFSLNFHV
ncbi:MAG: hypothetical protein OMM_04891 [Candidatus Magnetoglobus multicellularis str. Araruama]|uniref:Uncharacterized protein n=1 Tax=Candidatus Magnetoglobus multicellularis str. Araruama TaxID=890399 RepID=A0A1V1NZA5_9BACT|nr:MAG: hypothetical protein OMM_04891 [Candidatus Magnetoglobus multicellularis str. Araruama]